MMKKTDDSAPPPDPDKGIYVFCSGRKGSGKTEVCRAWFDSYPYDKIVLDITHDLRADFRRDGVEFDELRGGLELPARLPAARHDKPRTWVFCPDMGSDTALDDMDRVVGLGIGRGPTLIWFDEFGEMTTGNSSPPNTRRVLHHGRHDALTCLFACPRPMDINALAINQADLVYSFAMANPDDRARVAKNIGWNVKEFDEVNEQVKARGDYWHSLYDHRAAELWIMPPLPIRRRGRNAQTPPIGEPGDLAAAAAADELDARVRDARRR